MELKLRAAPEREWRKKLILVLLLLKITGGIRRSRTTTLFRITNFELFAKPVRKFLFNYLELLLIILEQASDGNRSRLYHGMCCIHYLPQLHT